MKKVNYNPFEINIPYIKIRPGVLLISPPLNNDLYFNKSVVLIVEHNDHGSVGFVLNRQTEFMAGETIAHIGNFDSKLHFGGPVQVNTLHFIHNLGEKIPNTEKVTKDIYWGGDFDTVYKMINEGKIKPENIKFFLGYSGWAPGQLETELKNNYWYMTKINKYDIWKDTSNLWYQTLSDLGFNNKVIKNIPPDPSLN